MLACPVMGKLPSFSPLPPPRPSPEPLSLPLGRGQPEDKGAESLPGAEVGAWLGIQALTPAFILGSRPLRPALGLSVQGRPWAQALKP